MNNAVLFSSRSDEWETPQDVFDSLHAEFNFEVDLAATYENRKCERWWDKDDDSLSYPWYAHADRGWLNPPYSRSLCAKFIAKASEERRQGFLTVMLLPARTDTRAFHAYIWDSEKHRPRGGVEVRFLSGRLRFSGCTNAAPFPSMIVVFYPATAR